MVAAGLSLPLPDALNEFLTAQSAPVDPLRSSSRSTTICVAMPAWCDNVITTLDLRLQELAEKALQAKAKRGAIVVVDPNTGDILALASWPTYDPNLFVPSISTEKFKALQDDPNIPLLPRAFRSSYPPGSTFKIAVGIAALESGSVGPDDTYECVPSIEIGNLTFHNWKKGDRGALNFIQALTESCDTWFYQVGIKPARRRSLIGRSSWALARSPASRCGARWKDACPTTNT